MPSNRACSIAERLIGPGHPIYCIAEMSANHNGSYDRAVEILHAAKASGADAVKLQTYTADTITIDCDNEYFQIKGTIWEGYNLYRLYQEAFTPWEWQPRLKAEADRIGIDFFSTPFDNTAVDFLEAMNVPCYKVASFELIDIPLLKRIAATGRPVIMSTGMGTLAEIDEAVRTLRENGCSELALLKCVSSYPAVPEEMNLRTIPHLAESFGCPAGLSDHTMDIAVPVAAVALGACIIEKHFTLSRQDEGPDSQFSLEPHEFRQMVDAVRAASLALGQTCYDLTPKQEASRVYRRSLFAAEDIAAGEVLTEKNVRSVRPGHGLHPRYLEIVLGKTAAVDIDKGTPLDWGLLF